jgi:hypothetical protein
MEISDEDKSIFSTPKRQTFTVICLATLVLLYIKKTMIEDQTAAFDFLLDQPAGAALHLRSALQYISIPLIYMWKFTVIGFVVWVGCFLFGYRVTYSQCWNIAMVAEFVFMIPELIKIGWFLFVHTDPRFHDIQGFYPLSIITLVDYTELPTQYAYPLRSLNLFEPLYWLVIATGISHFARRGMKPAWTIVLAFYVPIYLLWLGFYIIVY